MSEWGQRVFRLAVVAHRPQPYQSALFRALAAHPQIDLTVYYLYDVGVGATPDSDFGRYQWDYPVLDGYRSQFLRNRAPWGDKRRFAGSFHPELCSRLIPRFYDAVLIHGWFGLSMWLALLTCWTRGLPVLFRCDANMVDPVPPARRWLKQLVLPRLFRRCQAFLTIGQRNAEFYRRHGVGEEKLFLLPFAVDNDFFQQQRAAGLSQRAEIRRQLGLPEEAVVFLYAGRLAPEKGLENLLDAVHSLRDPRAWLILAGEGGERRPLEHQARSRGLTQVQFVGFQLQNQLARCYLAADVFVLPSQKEPWGLVVNEAMNFGLPIVASEIVGAVPDLLEVDGNGMVFPPGDVEALRRCLKRLLTDPSLRLRLGQRSLEIIGKWSHRHAAEAMLEALNFAARERRS